MEVNRRLIWTSGKDEFIIIKSRSIDLTYLCLLTYTNLLYLFLAMTP